MRCIDRCPAIYLLNFLFFAVKLPHFLKLKIFVKYIHNTYTTRKPVGFMQSCFLCWFPCGYLNNTSCPYGHHMASMWKPVVSCGNHIVSAFETLCCPPGNHIVSTWKPNGVHLETTWCAHGNHIISTWQPCSVHRNYMVSMWKPCGVHMETMWFSHGNYVVSIFESMYCP